MGTHAMIGIYNQENGSVDASYCHYDGYVEGVGRTLVGHYNTQYDAEVVARGGYMSSLCEDYVETRLGSVHDEGAVTYESVEQFLALGFEDCGSDYLYLWDGSMWFFAGRSQPQFEEVEMNLQEVV